MRTKALLCLAVWAAGCAYHRSYAPEANQWSATRLAVAPFANLTEYPHAGSIVTELWRTELGVRGFDLVPGSIVRAAAAKLRAEEGAGAEAPVDPVALGTALGVTHIACGSVSEFRYKFGLDGEPAAGISAEIINVEKATVSWRGSASKSGFGHDSLNRVAQGLCEHLAGSIAWNE
jgi:hypothetical protein